MFVHPLRVDEHWPRLITEGRLGLGRFSVRIAIGIQAESGSGFDDSIQGVAKENCNVLKFKNAEFE